MKCLVDSHALLWFLTDDPRLGTRARNGMSDPANELWFSVVSHWEICIKISLGKLRLRDGWESEMDGWMVQSGIRWLGLKPEHSAKVVRLPFHHRDPFDRILVAQAQVEDMTILSGDAQIATYSVPVIW